MGQDSVDINIHHVEDLAENFVEFLGEADAAAAGGRPGKVSAVSQIPCDR